MAGNCLTLADRREIERLYAADEKPSVIAAAVGVSVATIYRELKRGETGGLNGNYCPAYSAETAEKAVVVLRFKIQLRVRAAEGNLLRLPAEELRPQRILLQKETAVKSDAPPEIKDNCLSKHLLIKRAGAPHVRYHQHWAG